MLKFHQNIAMQLTSLYCIVLLSLLCFEFMWRSRWSVRMTFPDMLHILVLFWLLDIIELWNHPILVKKGDIELILSFYTQVLCSDWLMDITLFGNITIFGCIDVRRIRILTTKDNDKNEYYLSFLLVPSTPFTPITSITPFTPITPFYPHYPN